MRFTMNLTNTCVPAIAHNQESQFSSYAKRESVSINYCSPCDAVSGYVFHRSENQILWVKVSQHPNPYVCHIFFFFSFADFLQLQWKLIFQKSSSLSQLFSVFHSTLSSIVTGLWPTNTRKLSLSHEVFWLSRYSKTFLPYDSTHLFHQLMHGI